MVQIHPPLPVSLFTGYSGAATTLSPSFSRLSSVLLRVSPLELIENKLRLLREFNNSLSPGQKERVINDSHVKRNVRWCGLTVHFTINCPFQCSYCYIEDMGFSFSNPKPYPLSGRELAFALLLNPRFLPGRTGTLLAIGAVSEPFIFFNNALDKLEWLAKLGNPIQFSTKQYISSVMAEKIKNISSKYNTPISPLVTIISFEFSDLLENKAPNPEKRLDSIKNLRDAGLSPILFLRPLIPGVNLHEVDSILTAAKKAGAVGAVIGSFRITLKILQRLESIDINVKQIKRRIKRIDNVQRSIPLPEKKLILKKIRDYGLIPWASACCANSWTANVPCPSACFINGPCTNCPNNCNYPRDVPDDKDVAQALVRLGIKIKVKGSNVLLLNYPFRGVEMTVRNISRRVPIVKKEFKKKE